MKLSNGLGLAAWALSLGLVLAACGPSPKSGAVLPAGGTEAMNAGPSSMANAKWIEIAKSRDNGRASYDASRLVVGSKTQPGSVVARILYARPQKHPDGSERTYEAEEIDYEINCDLVGYRIGARRLFGKDGGPLDTVRAPEPPGQWKAPDDQGIAARLYWLVCPKGQD